MNINENFEKLPESYLFSTVARRLKEFREWNPEADVIRMDIGDVTRPVAGCVLKAMHEAVDQMGDSVSFRGYGPEQGYEFLREAIAENDYRGRGINISAEDIFISDGAKSDLGNLSDIYDSESIIAVADPGYPVYVDSNVIGGYGGDFIDGRFSNIVYLDCTQENGFLPQVPELHADVVILCSPSNPTGACFSRGQLHEWVEYAKRNRSLIVFDSAYEAFVRDENIPRSIYEIEGAEEVAIEVRSFSKTAGFTGLRCGYTVVPSALRGYDREGNAVSLRKLWLRRQTTKFNGASYIIQYGAAALYTEEGRKSIKENIDYYLRNARIIRRAMQEIGFDVTGGENSPYVWARSGSEAGSWEIFGYLLEKAAVSCTPGIGFGRNGEGCIRLTGFNTYEKTLEAMERIKSLKLG